MRKIILLVVFTIATFSSGQKIPFTILKSLNFTDEYKESAIVFSNVNEKGELLTVRSYKSNKLSYHQGFYIENYTKDLKFLNDFDFEIKHPLSEKNCVVLGVFSLNNVLQIVEMYYDLKQKTFICQTNSISSDFKVSKKELFRLTNEEIKNYGNFSLQELFYQRANQLWNNDNSGDLGSLSEGNESSSSSGFFNAKYESEKQSSCVTLVVNESKTAFAIALDFNGKDSEVLKLYLFDKQLNKKIETDFIRKVKDKKYVIQNMQVSNNGDSILLLAKAFLEAEKKKRNGGKYVFELTKINADSQNSQVIETNENYIRSLKLLFHDNELICIGFYSDLADYKYKGICYFKLNADSLVLLKSKFNLFTEQFMIDKYGENKDKALKFLSFRKLFFTSTNDLIFNAEEEYTKSSGGVSYGFGGMSSPGMSALNFDDILSAKLSSDGDLIWARNINKTQSSDADNSFVSYSSMIKNDETYFFINAGEKIKKLKNDRIEFKGIRKNKSNLNVIRINNNGDFDYEEILDDENSAVPFMVSKGAILDANSILFLGRKGNTKQLIRVTL